MAGIVSLVSRRREGLKRYIERADAHRLEIGISAEAADKLKRLSSFGVSGDFPEVEPFYAARLLEQALEDLGDDPVEGIQTMPARQSEPPQVGDAAPDVLLPQTRLSDQWKEQTALLVFLRHYG